MHDVAVRDPARRCAPSGRAARRLPPAARRLPPAAQPAQSRRPCRQRSPASHGSPARWPLRASAHACGALPLRLSSRLRVRGCAGRRLGLRRARRHDRVVRRGIRDSLVRVGLACLLRSQSGSGSGKECNYKNRPVHPNLLLASGNFPLRLDPAGGEKFWANSARKACRAHIHPP